MKTINKLYLALALVSLPAVGLLYATCWGEFEFRASPTERRSDNRCNMDSDCPANMRCSAVSSMCELC